MKKRTKVMLTVLCAALLVAASVMGTMAYLTSVDAVQNTFTVGKLDITLDEADTDELGVPLKNKDGGLAARVDENEYKLIPGRTYVKDPTVHVAPGSEASYVFVSVWNGLAALDIDLTAQIEANGWKELEGHDGVYFQKVDATGTEVKDLAVFEGFTVPTTVTGKQLQELPDGQNAPAVNVAAYACQQDTFETAKEAWETCFVAD